MQRVCLDTCHPCTRARAGTWAGGTVAVKVLRYSSELCHLVQREVLLCHALSHTHVVGALHFVEVGPGGRLQRLQLNSSSSMDAHSTCSSIRPAPGGVLGLGQGGQQLGAGEGAEAVVMAQGGGGIEEAAGGGCKGGQRSRAGGASGSAVLPWDEEPAASTRCSVATSGARGGMGTGTGTGTGSGGLAAGGGKARAGDGGPAAAAAVVGVQHTCHGFLVMELCEGGSVDAWRLQRWRGQGEEAVDMVSGLWQGQGQGSPEAELLYLT